MDAKWLIAAALAALTAASCSQVMDGSDFAPVKTTSVTASALPTPTDPKAPADTKSPADATAAAAPAATDQPTQAAALAPAQAGTARSLFAMLLGPSDTPPKAQEAEAAIRTEEAGAPKAADTAAATAAPDAKATDGKTADGKTADGASAPQAAEDDAPDEISEADLAGEAEADPTKVAVPEEPINDGLEHDFVNVYTSKPDKPVEKIEGLPGVDWNNGIVMASIGSDDDPRDLFGGETHPFAQQVPGIPHQTVQAANGLLLAWSGINVDCVKPNLLGLVRRAEGHFGHKVVVTSGYRSPSHNRRVRGALHSQHLYCNALDLYMPGVSRDDLARYFFDQPDRGGLGLYCHTRSIHIDTGRRREWRWSCTRRG
ncbi:YcbK family protein [Oryzibacter oryziterrae]|uniref:YcbK family protein n=1 Tax=Oryzibacter oryziterrae TaxID=2766474 RepID=UPI001F36069C|nr:D-Ala-D-Ala carboxypeptidase family metallohydrolase [Oryzibacter oryziterrae]